MGLEKSDSLKPKGPLSDLGEMPGHMFIDAILVARCTHHLTMAGAAHGSRNHSFFLGPLSYILGQDGPILGAVVVTARPARPVINIIDKRNSPVTGSRDSLSHK